MKIYNTLTRKKEEFIPIEEGKVRMYVCGPTVYNFIHIGNARPMIIFDTVRRYLEYKGYQVTYVTNFTDVDDKIIKRALEEGVDAGEIAERYIGEFIKDMNALNVREASIHPRATREIDGMIDLISGLIDKGYAYEKNGTVYFRARSFKDYGKLSKKNIDDLEAGARVDVDEAKEDPLDFVLWKPKKEGEPYWPSPWGDGRPGWHIECSVMSSKYLGGQLDIHGGGEDLIFPHHENEIAQSEAASGKPLARYWMHNAFLNIDNKKMSKSAGNFFTVREICEQYPPQVLRFLMLNAHYRNPMNFSRELMEAARNSLERIQNGVYRLEHLLAGRPGADDVTTPEESRLLEEVQHYRIKFEEAMEDDFNTADAITAIFELVRLANTNCGEGSSTYFIKAVLDIITKLSDILGLKVRNEEEMLDAEIEKLINERQEARRNKDFARADAIRELLLQKGIILEDTREGVRWKRI